MKLKTMILSVLFICGASAVIFAYDLETVLPDLSEEEYEDLRAGEILEASTLDGEINHYAPKGSMAYYRTIAVEGREDGFTINSISLIPYPESFAQMDLEERQLEIFNTMRSISTQEGITYISYRRGNEPRTLIRDSWYLETPGSRSKLPDPVVDELPRRAESYVYQRDTSFGGNVYKHRYTISEREIYLDIDNVETMRILSIIPVVRPGNLTITMASHQTDEGLLVYALANIAEREPRVSFLGIEVYLPGAFSRRITSLQEWFVDQLLN